MSEHPTANGLMASVIIPAYNAADVLPACLTALEQQTLRRTAYEVLVVDDGSDDATAATAEAAGARTARIAHSGAAAARNVGVSEALAPIVVFTDADCIPAPDFLERLLEPFADPMVSGARGVYRSQQRQIVARFVQLEYEERYQRIERYAARHGTVDALDTSYCAYRREVFLEAGGFDTRFGSAAGEDHELSYRLAQQGHIFRMTRQAVVCHHHVTGVWDYARRKARVGFWKAFLARQHPTYVLEDSHTTQSLKAQIVLVGLMMIALLLWLLWPGAGWMLLALVLLFVISALPFLRLALKRDGQVLLPAIPLLLVRAAASGIGFIGGLAAAHPRRFQG